jgi:Flp pilus assembly protein TadD
MVHVLLVLLALAMAGQTPVPADLVKQGRELANKGQHEEAIRLYRDALRGDPKSFDARLAIGVSLDIQGQYAEARTHLNEAAKLASAGAQRNQAANAMAVSYAFESKAAEAVKHLAPVFEQQRADKDAAGAAGTANAIGRIYLETGDPANSRKWYALGYEQATQGTGLSPADLDLWALRWLHAEARIAARAGKAAEARTHIAAFEQAMQKRGKLDEDNAIYRYLLGYVAYYTKDYDKAIAELAKGDLSDPFIANLLAMSYETKGDTANAQKFYRRALESNVHILQTAFARPIAKAKIKN